MSEEETLFEFPCLFPIKAMGLNKPEFNSIVIHLLQQHVDEINDNDIKSKFSKGDKYLSITITILASSKKQLDAIYQDLSDCPDVLMAL